MNRNQKNFLNTMKEKMLPEIKPDTDVIVCLVQSDNFSVGFSNTDHPKKLLSAAIDVLYRVTKSTGCDCEECKKLKAAAHGALDGMKHFVTTIETTESGETLQ